MVEAAAPGRAGLSDAAAFLQQSPREALDGHEGAGAGDSSNSSQDTQMALDTYLLHEGSRPYGQAQTPAGDPQGEGALALQNSSSDALKQVVGFDAALNRYVCQWCGRNFDRISNLKRHVLLHSGIKPFKCLYCNYRATQKANVVQHLASRHREEMRALLQNNINVNDILVPSGPVKR